EGIVGGNPLCPSKTASWADYPLSVIKALLAFGFSVESGADFYFEGDLPGGSGLSSSAALEVVTITAVKELFSLCIPPQLAAVIGQFAENRFIGVACGIMDQFASAIGRAENAVLLNSDTLFYRCVPVKGSKIVIVNSSVKHSLASSQYNTRRKQCEQAAAALGVKNLCDLTPEQFEQKKHMLTDDILLRRARHAVYENRRALDAANALERGDIAHFGKLMNLSHTSLRDDYEVSCEELDFLADFAQNTDGVYGARMTGGGFGGCTVNLVKKECVSVFTARISAAYKEKFDIIPEIYHITPADGAKKL
ncbi:MAG: galactokinase, partial [Clostridia bacterium]|nr:galactokinase [Clostridia bacterium]